MTQTLKTLHPDIVKILAESGVKAVSIVDPSPGLFGDEPIEGLVDIQYECNCTFKYEPRSPRHGKTHGMLFGPVVISFTDSCKTCNKLKMWCNLDKSHEYEAIGVEVLDREHYELYAS